MTVLLAVLELEPATYAKRVRTHPNVPSAEDPEGWSRYWTESLSDAGIVGLTPYKPGSWFVPLSAMIDPAVLRRVVQAALPDPGRWEAEEPSPLPGGYVLGHGDRQIEPGCCSDLGNLESWEAATEHVGPSWAQVWIGHPWTHVRGVGSVLDLAEPSEHDASGHKPIAISVQRADLARAVSNARLQRDAFAELLVPVVATFQPTISPRKVVEILVGGHG